MARKRPKWWVIIYICEGEIRAEYHDTKWDDAELRAMHGFSSDAQLSEYDLKILAQIPVTLGEALEHGDLDEMLRELCRFAGAMDENLGRENILEMFARAALAAFIAGTKHGEVVIPPDPDDEA